MATEYRVIDWEWGRKRHTAVEETFLTLEGALRYIEQHVPDDHPHTLEQRTVSAWEPVRTALMEEQK